MRTPVFLDADGVLHCVLSTTAGHCTLDMDAVEQATTALLEGKGRAVLLVGEGSNFCSGGDVAAFAAADSPGSFVAGLAETLHAFVRAVTTSSAPVVAAVHGWATGAGMSLACAADITVCGSSARFRPAYPAIGLSPDGGMTWTLPRLIGPARARDLLLTDGVLGADEALRTGLVSRVVADDDVRAEALSVARQLAAKPPQVLARVKALLHEGADRDLFAHLDAEAESIGEAAESPVGREGVRAFIERRPPRFPV
ncbi:enoyl-CoA hydratase/isomerase family protein [Streptomyces sp. NPDC127091]|uniref:enoyl-CoA hydratase/isomerase family protein n=1 Tax=Streptomyces sp. NPDC127091 TaxID=3347134 RepID=UPI003662A39D